MTLRQNKAALAFLLGWLAINAAVFAWGLGLPLTQAALTALRVHKADGVWGRFYASFTDVVVFGAIASFVVGNVTRRYRPEATCAALAAEMRGHLVVIGYSNLGRRLHQLVSSRGGQVVIVEEDRALVEALIQAEEPLVLGSAKDEATLKAAGVEEASVVVIATDDLETVGVACRLVRLQNPKCKLVVRCPDDDVGQVLAKAYAAKALSTSKIAAQMVRAHAVKAGSRKALVVGVNSVGRRVVEALENERVTCQLIGVTEDAGTLAKAGVAEVDLVVIADDDLGKNMVRVDRVRDANPNALVLCRVFHEEAAEILAKKPFSCVLLSSSRLAAEFLVGDGVLKDVGVVARRGKS
ncbi:MAG: NAD-binding protein [Polyangiaceae bacterium]|nr:NAD-binding protein [Polyangiaceae bacterium]